MKRALVLSALLMAAPVLALAQAPGAPPAFIRAAGVVTAVGDDSVTLKAADGAVTVVPLARTWTVVATRPRPWSRW